ncbi:MAG: phosphohydrolase [Colwelliaceae bacterium]|nr:phosphohydrolase [Colwelliaceae bacterium]
MIKEIAIDELHLGHYVVDIVQQQGNYQLKNAGHVKSGKIIDNLISHGVSSLLIDTAKTLEPINETSKESSSPLDKRHFSSTTTSSEPLSLELAQAKKIFAQAKLIQSHVLQNIVTDTVIDLEPVKEVTDQTVESVFQNPDALACVLNIRIKGQYLLEHSVSVSVLVAIFARHLAIEKRIAKDISLGAFLHDVGKIKIPDEILNKPYKLTEDEFEIMKTHVEHSIDIIRQIPNISELALEVAAMHHEKLDGSGYPYQLAHGEISLYGRMIAICDIFDALTADRVYKQGYSHVKAFNILRKLASQGVLDARLVDEFIRCMGVYPVGSLVELSSHRLAIVEGRTKDPIRPKVRSFYNIDYRHYTMAEDIDLSSAKENIVKSVRADDYNLEMNKIVEFLMLQG